MKMKMIKFHLIINIIIIVGNIILFVNGQYRSTTFHRPHLYSPMAFSPYHPARINHETLPISQAEFAQLVAESMATSRGPHHHHPPNTDQNYEGPEHWSTHDGDSHSGAESVNEERHHHHHHHYNHPHSSQSNQESQMYQHQSQNDHHASGSMQSTYSNSMHRPHSQSHYQPDEHGHHNDVMESDNHMDHYNRAPVFETGYTPDHVSFKENEMFESEQPIYGGRPNSEPFQFQSHQQQHSHNQQSFNGQQPINAPNNSPPLAFHQDFSRQYQHARNPHSHHHHHHHHHQQHSHRPSFHHSGPLNTMQSHPNPQMIMLGRQNNQQFNSPRYHHNHNHQHQQQQTIIPPVNVDPYMAADSSTSNAIVVVVPTVAAQTSTTITTTSSRQ